MPRSLSARSLSSLHSLEISSPGESNLQWSDVEFLLDATRTVVRVRHCLKFTYVFAYYLPEGPEKTLFEFAQQQLEQSCETLSELSEQPIDHLDRQQIINYERITLQFMNNLLDATAKGLTKE